MTREQVLWAKQHDWFVSATPPTDDTPHGWTVEVKENYHDGEQWHEREAAFTDFQQMRAWAGY